MSDDAYYISKDDPKYLHEDVDSMSVDQLQRELATAMACPYAHPMRGWWSDRARELQKAIERQAQKRERPSEAAPPSPRPTPRHEAAKPKAEPEPKPEPKAWTVADLIDTEFAPPKWVVPDLLPVGLASLAGRPKVGKSWLALQLSVAVAAGGYFLDRQVESGNVLYLALEDSPRRLKLRLERLGWALRDLPLQFYCEWDALSDTEALLKLEAKIVAVKPRLVVIDTLTRAWGGGLDWNDVGPVTEALGRLQRLALETDCCILTVDHLRKPNGMAADPITDILGSTGKVAVADTVLGLYKNPDGRGATLRITGRDIEDAQLAIEFDAPTCAWQLLGDAREVAATEAQEEVIAALEALGGKATAGELAKEVGLSRQTARRHLERLTATGRIRRRTETVKGRATVIYELSQVGSIHLQ